MLLHSEGPSHRDGFTQRDDFTKGCFYTQVLLHGDAYNAEMLLHTGALGHKYFYTEMCVKRNFWILDAGAFSHRRLYTEMLCTGVSHTNTFTPCFCIQVLLYRDSVTRKCFYADIL